MFIRIYSAASGHASFCFGIDVYQVFVTDVFDHWLSLALFIVCFV
jgi:hypothetical protein